MKNYRVRCRAVSGEVINEYFLSANDERQAAVKNRRHPDYERSAFMALEKGIYEYEYVIEAVELLN